MTHNMRAISQTYVKQYFQKLKRQCEWYTAAQGNYFERSRYTYAISFKINYY